eukprot:763886-Hanusia_phi.AAC.1
MNGWEGESVGGTISGRYEYYPRVKVKALVPSQGPSVGGTVVTVMLDGRIGGQDGIGEWLCVFGDSRSNGQLNVSSPDESSVACNLPPSVPSTVSVQVRRPSGQKLPGGLRFEYVLQARLISVSPSHGGAGGGSRVTITGEGIGREGLKCWFGGKAVEGEGVQWISSSLIVCSVCRVEKDSVVALKVDWSGFILPDTLFYTVITPFVRSIEGTYADIQGIDTLQVLTGDDVVYEQWLDFVKTCSLQIKPSRIFTGQRSIITISGLLSQKSLYRCRINNISSPIRYKNGHFVSFVPSISDFEGRNPFEVYDSIYDYQVGITSIEISASPRISFIYPCRGPVHGGIAIEVHGEHFFSPKMRIGNALLNSKLLSSSLIGCILPPVDIPGMYQLQIEFAENIEIFNHSKTFMFEDSPTIMSIQPNQMVHDTVGKILTVFGENFNSNLICIFGNISALALSSPSSSILQCSVPSLKVGVLSFSISFTGLLNPDVQHVPLIVESNRLRIVSVYPTILNSGHQTNLVLLKLHPIGTMSNGELFCVANDTEFSKASLLNTTVILCEILPFLEGQLKISVCHRRTCGSFNDAVVSVIPPMAIHQVLPSLGPIGGAPPMPMGRAYLRLSLHGNDRLVGSLPVEFVAEPMITMIQPTNVLLSSGNRPVVTVYGNYFIDTEMMLCRFGQRQTVRGQ